MEPLLLSHEASSACRKLVQLKNLVDQGENVKEEYKSIVQDQEKIKKTLLEKYKRLLGKEKESTIEEENIENDRLLPFIIDIDEKL